MASSTKTNPSGRGGSVPKTQKPSSKRFIGGEGAMGAVPNEGAGEQTGARTGSEDYSPTTTRTGAGDAPKR
ncbi:MAG: hypothetical protein ACYSUN_10045 [Planctomycetota bacterium]|jgi:hypothetical protein